MGTIGIACKFITLFDKWIFWPSFPNILDAAFLIISVLYLALRQVEPTRKQEINYWTAVSLTLAVIIFLIYVVTKYGH